jgi:hypothetical protein
MATIFANIKGVTALAVPRTLQGGGVAIVSFDLAGTAQAGGGTDTIQLGGGGSTQGVPTTQTLAEIIAARVRNNKAVTLTSAMGPVQPGYQGGIALYPQAPSVDGGNAIGIGLYTLPIAGAPQSSPAGTWDAAAVIAIGFIDTAS